MSGPTVVSSQASQMLSVLAAVPEHSLPVGLWSALSGDREQVLRPLRELLAAGCVRSGVPGGTWQITDLGMLAVEDVPLPDPSYLIDTLRASLSENASTVLSEFIAAPQGKITLSMFTDEQDRLLGVFELLHLEAIHTRLWEPIQFFDDVHLHLADVLRECSR